MDSTGPRNLAHPLPRPDAPEALRHLLALAGSTLRPTCAARQGALADGWLLWPLGGFHLKGGGGSVLQRRASAWQSLGTAPVQAERDQQDHPTLEVRLFHTYEGRDGREKCSVSEARFEYLAASGNWRLVVEYEAYMDSPLFGFEAEGADALLDLGLWNLLIDTPSPGGRSRLQQIALSPGWLELLCVSRRPEEVALDSS